MADKDYTSVYRQFFEEFARTVKPEDPLPIGAPPYNVDSCEMMGEIIESCMQYLTINKCPQCLIVPLINIAIEEISKELNKQNKNEYESLKVMQMCTSKINEICLRFTDNEKVSSLPPPVNETHFSHHGIKHVRRRMEDRLICIPKFHSLYKIQSTFEAGYYGLFDGHTGSTAATYAVSHLHQFLAESPHYPNDPISALHEAYIKTDSRFLAKGLRGGTTALVILHMPELRKLIVSWLGDSQAMLVRQDGYMLLVNPHRAGRRDESERISNLGGFVMQVNGSYRVNGQIAVSRAIGDQPLKPLLSAVPDIREIELTGSEEFLVIGCDGLWDVVEPCEVIEAVYSQMKEKPDNIDSVSRRLVDLAKKNDSTDNISVIVVFLADLAEISNRSVEAIGPRPRNLSQGEMDTNFQTASEKSPFVALSDQGMNRIYEENGRNADYMDQLKEDSDEDLGPETDIDAVDDVLVSPTKGNNPFANDLWKKGGNDCDGSHDLIDYGKQEDLNMDRDVVNFSDNINKFLKDKSENESVEGLAGSEMLDNVQMNEINSSYITEMESALSASQNIKFSSYSPVNNEFIEDIKFDNDNEKSGNSDFKEHSFVAENEKDFVGVNDFSDFEKLQNNLSHDIDHGESEIGQSEILCNGNAENHSEDKADVEKPVEPIVTEEMVPASEHNVDRIDEEGADDAKVTSETNDTSFEIVDKSMQDEENSAMSSTEMPDLRCEIAVSPAPDSALKLAQALSDSENASQKDADIETPELLSPTIPSQDENLKDDIVTESGGEADSEDDEWHYMQVGSGAPADERIDSVALSPQVAETDISMMNSPLNPHAAEFVPVAPVSNPTESETQKTPLRNVPPSVNDIIASSPNWTTMDNVDVPDEASFFKEIRTRPSNIFVDSDQSTNDPEGLGCTEINLDGKVGEQDSHQSSSVMESPASENLIPEVEQQSPAVASESAPHGIDLASDMTSSFIDTSTMSTDTEMSKQIFELSLQEKEKNKSETFSTLNVDAAEFKSEMSGVAADVANKLPDLLSPFPVADGNDEVKNAAPANVSLLETNLADFIQPTSPVVESSSVPDVQASPVKSEEAEMDKYPETDKPEKVETADLLGGESVQPVAESLPSPEPAVKAAEPSPAAEAAVVAAAAVAGVTASAAAALVEKKEEPKKAPATPTTTTAPSKVMKSTPSAKTPPSAAKATPAAKKPTTPLASKTPTSKPASTTATSRPGAKPLAPKVSSTTRTVTTTSATMPRPLARKTTATTATTATASKTTTATTARPLASRAAAPAKTTPAPRVSSTVTAPKPKPRVPSAPIEKKPPSTADAAKRPDTLAKRPGLASSTVTTTTRTLASRPFSAPLKSTVKTTTTVTATRTTTAKPRTSLTGVTTTTTTTTTTNRTVLNSKKPLSVTSKDVGSKPLSRTVISKVNGVANGNASKTTTKTTVTSKTKVENKTETKAENVLGPSGDIIQNENENPIIDNNKEVNLINGIGHD